MQGLVQRGGGSGKAEGVLKCQWRVQQRLEWAGCSSGSGGSSSKGLRACVESSPASGEARHHKKRAWRLQVQRSMQLVHFGSR